MAIVLFCLLYIERHVHTHTNPRTHIYSEPYIHPHRFRRIATLMKRIYCFLSNILTYLQKKIDACFPSGKKETNEVLCLVFSIPTLTQRKVLVTSPTPESVHENSDISTAKRN